QIAARARVPFGRYLGMGITLLIGGQALVNAAVVTGLLPTKGLTLPFVSYGGSSLVVSLMGVGILLSISRDRHAGGPRSGRGGSDHECQSSSQQEELAAISIRLWPWLENFSG